MDDYKYLFKIVLVGNAGVGKTCIVKRFTQGIFPLGQGATIGVDFMIKTVHINGIKIKLQIWDTAGQERFRSITQSYYRSANAIILVYDVTNKSSFEALTNWLAEIKNFSTPNVFIALVGNKNDRIPERQVTQTEASEFAQAHSLPLLSETSAKDGTDDFHVTKLFDDVARHLLSTHPSPSPTLVNQAGLLIHGPINHRASTIYQSAGDDALIDVFHKRNIRNEILSDAFSRTKNSCC
ncbi:unnamed protein product [Gordionus sp. m RMFG-2023]|uniref:ras-related protein Rab-30-like n=1 Tax=Gordionus sp. m RMFG-2023 TaxID=3053472 RepID=UPI0030DFD87F